MSDSLPASRSYEQIASGYEQARGGSRRARDVAEGFARWLEPRSLILDVGSGTAIVAEEVRRAGHTVIPLDLSPSMLAQAATRFPGQVLRADGQSLPVASAAFDAVLFVWSLHHIGDPVLALLEARRALRPGGRIVAVAGKRNPADDDLQPWFVRLDSLRPDIGLTVEAIASHAKSAGLKVVASAATSGTFDQSPLELASQIERRMFSPLWGLSDEEWDDRVQPVLEGLRALPNPDRQRRCQSHHPVLLLELDDLVGLESQQGAGG